ncbi:MAG: tetratricopeptide repeat protein [Tepidisphaeraceae bacterium]
MGSTPTGAILLEQAKQHHHAGRLAEAESLYRVILLENPENPDALHLLGLAVFQLGRPAEAAQLIRQAIRINPSKAQYHCNLGVILSDSDRPASIASFRQAIALQPGFLEALNNLARMLLATGSPGEAIEVFAELVRLDPNAAEAHVYLCYALADAGKIDRALTHGRRGVELKPDFSSAHHALANMLKETGQIEEAVDHYRRAVELNPREAFLHHDLLFALQFDPRSGPGDLLAEHRDWARRFAVATHPRPPAARREEAGRRLRVGYVSPDFRNHPIGRFMLPLIKGHEHEQFEIFCYSGTKSTDEITAALRQHADTWSDIRDLSDEALADLIRTHKIDILVDLTMHMADNRLGTFARKPAPVQVTYLAYPGTTGLETIDYRLSDPYLDPPGIFEPFYSEKTIRLPQTYWCYEPIHTLDCGALPADSAPVVTFASFNNPCKISAAVWESWRRLLQTVPHSRLIVSLRAASHADRLRADLASAGLNPQRLSIMPPVSTLQYFHQFTKVDIALDPFPYCGGTTTCDALWMGVPVVTLAGQRATGRGGVSILTNIGLPELIAPTPDDYVQIAAKLACDLPALRELRATLRERMAKSPLMGAKRFAANFETLYREIWIKSHAPGH